MLRPFKFLVHHETTIRSSLQHLEDDEDIPVNNSPASRPFEPQRSRRQSSATHSSPEAQIVLSHMRCLIEFMDKYLTPVLMHWTTGKTSRIYFDDLWYIFRPGENIYIPVKARHQKSSINGPAVPPDRFYSLYQTMWRVTASGGGRPDLSMSRHGNPYRKINAFKVNCYHIDYDGKYFIPIIHTYSVEPYKGSREVTSLPFFPIRFLEQAQEIQEQNLTQKRLVFDAIVQSHKHFYYVGPTMTRQSCDCPISMEEDSPHQEHIESEVIIDHAAALQRHPSWAPKLSPWKQEPTQANEVQNKFRIRYWNDQSKSQLVRTELEHIYNDNVIDRARAMTFKSNEKLFNPFPSAWLGNDKLISEADVSMLAARTFGFVLRTRTFAPLWLWGLEPVQAQTDSLRNLQLRDNSFKDIIHALVRTHFLQKNARSSSERDFVRGKGKGLIFLLHGAPGVGKTLTAESVAAANGRPLFQITCGDLGLSPAEVERSLNDIFRAAQVRDCVLLLDECDVFLQQRDRTDLQRNSLVSVFLRVLEFYSGVLFLTTNRVGTLDSAVTARITWSTHYPPLDLNQTKEIWKVNLDQLKEQNPNVRFKRSDILNFAKEQFNTTIEDGSNWNGRQIQNACKVALSLAGWDVYSNEEQQGMDVNMGKDQKYREIELKSSHFRTVATAADTFKRYLKEATGRSESQRAYDAQERADTFVDTDPTLDPESNGNNLMYEASPRKTGIPSIAPFSEKKQRSERGSFGGDRATLVPDYSSAYQWQSGNSPAHKASRPRTLSSQSNVDGPVADFQTSRRHGATGSSSSYGVPGPAAQSQPTKKRKRQGERKSPYDGKDARGRRPPQHEDLESDSDAEPGGGDQDSGWE